MMKLSVKTSLLWIVMSGVFISSVVQAESPDETAIVDDREIIWVTAEEKAVLLSEMRAFLVATHEILEACLAKDIAAVEQAARPVGMKVMKATSKVLHAKFPEGFKTLGPKAHMGFEDIADEAAGLGDREVVLEHLAKLQKTCIRCHKMYGLEVK